jgi:hypothetical protein
MPAYSVRGRCRFGLPFTSKLHLLIDFPQIKYNSGPHYGSKRHHARETNAHTPFIGGTGKKCLGTAKHKTTPLDRSSSRIRVDLEIYFAYSF